jgi:Protein of unknown function (DUF3108)
VQLTLPILWVLAIASLIGQAPARPVKPTAPTKPSSPAQVERQVPFKSGEVLAYDISWSDYLTAATATVTVKDKRPSFGSTAYYLVAEGQPVGFVAAIYSVYYKVDSLLDVNTLLPQRASVFSQEGRRRRMQVTRFDQVQRKATYEITTATVQKHELRLPSPAQDPLSALYLLRTLEMRQGDTTTLAIVNEGTLHNVRVTIAGREPVETPLGRQSAWKLIPQALDGSGKPAGDEVTIWISDDARRLPLRIDARLDIGVFRLVLREARN